MEKFKQLWKLGFCSLCFLFCVSAFMPANAQRLANADILTTHVDREKGKMYVEMNFYAPSCGEHQVRFSFCNATTGADTLFNGALVLDSVLTNQHSAGSPRIDTIIDNVAGSYGKDSIRTVLRLDNTAVGGYHLRFDIKDTALFNPGEKPQLCMDVTRLALHCKYCGVERTSLVLDPLTVDTACPYKYRDSILYGKDTMLFYEDLITCRKREGSLAKNWEAFIQDPRDCRTYRIVQMPDSNWWFAQNLNFQSYPSNTNVKYRNNAADYQYDTLAHQYWCPGPDGKIAADEREDTTTANKWSCEVYGALYNGSSLLYHDGYVNDTRLTLNDSHLINGSSGPSGVPFGRRYIMNEPLPALNTDIYAVTGGFGRRPRAVCPPEWYVPTDGDWGIMLNATEGCLYPDSSITTANVTCNHLKTLFTLSDSGIRSPYIQPGGSPGVLSRTVLYANLFFKSTQLGHNAGRYLRATPTCANGAENCDDAPNAVPPQGLIHSGDTAQAKSSWTFAGSNNAGTDKYGFSVLPAGIMNKYNNSDANNSLSKYYGRGYFTIFLTSTFVARYGATSKFLFGAGKYPYSYSPVARLISYNRNDVQHFYYVYKSNDNSPNTNVGSDSPTDAIRHPSMTNAYSIRCMKPLKDWAKK